jgi:hypothetical protein
MWGDDETDTALLKEMSAAAQDYMQSFSWCKAIREAYFGDGYGGIVAVFLFRIEPARAEIDEWLWTIVGDIPPAYLVLDLCKSPSQALDVYIHGVSKWVSLAKQGKSSKDGNPVNVPATPENAAVLEKRLKTLRDVILPAFAESEAERA